jgi:hypothetical protein
MHIIDAQETDVIQFKGKEYTITEMSVSDSFKMQSLVQGLQDNAAETLPALAKLLTPYMGGLGEQIESMTVREFNKVLEAYGAFVSGSSQAAS